MDKFDYVPVNMKPSLDQLVLKDPELRERPPKHFHPLLRKEKKFTATVERILSKTVAGTVI